jgi:hypothetical protein
MISQYIAAQGTVLPIREPEGDYTKYSDEDLLATFSVKSWIYGESGERTESLKQVETEILKRMKVPKS